MRTAPSPTAAYRGQSGPDGPRPQWGWPQYLAIVGVPILVLNVWSVVAWLADGPSSVTDFRVRDGSWYAARAIEAGLVGLSVAMVISLIRGCRREGQFLTFDVMFCLAGSTIFWADNGPNFIQPVFSWSSQFVNLNGVCGHIPLVVNPECGTPDPILFNFLLGTFGFLAIARAGNLFVQWVRRRRPGLSTPQLIAVICGAGLIADLLFEPATIALAGTWTYAGPTSLSLPLGDGKRYVLHELVAGGLFFASLVLLYVLRNDKGERITEAGLAHLSVRRRKGLSMLAVYGFLQMAAWGLGNAPLWLYGPWADWPKLPAPLVNDICDAPGTTGTPYGPCPGSPGFRMPGPASDDRPG